MFKEKDNIILCKIWQVNVYIRHGIKKKIGRTTHVVGKNLKLSEGAAQDHVYEQFASRFENYRAYIQQLRQETLQWVIALKGIIFSVL